MKTIDTRIPDAFCRGLLRPRGAFYRTGKIGPLKRAKLDLIDTALDLIPQRATLIRDRLSFLREGAIGGATGSSSFSKMMASIDVLRRTGRRMTLLAVCPMSPDIIRAYLEQCQQNFSIPTFIATPRQVDVEGSYTGWTQKQFVQDVRNIARKAGYNGRIFFERDHGGPWQRPQDRSLSLNEAMSMAKRTYRADIDAGFHILHIDVTVDREKAAEALSAGEMAGRTIELISECESYRLGRRLPPVSYEVGSDEPGSNLFSLNKIEEYVRLVRSGLREKGLEHVWKNVVYVVADTGTKIEGGKQAGIFNGSRALDLFDLAGRFGLKLKQHHTDYLDNDQLAELPKAGVAGANVGPEFSQAEYEGLAELEAEVIKRSGGRVRAGFLETVKVALNKTEWWRRWFPGIEKICDLMKKEQREIVLACGRYVQNDESVRHARRELYRNAIKWDVSDPQRYIVDRIKMAMSRYDTAFALLHSRTDLAAARAIESVNVEKGEGPVVKIRGGIKKVVLINATEKEDPDARFPLSLFYLYGVMRRDLPEIDVKLLDLGVEKQVFDLRKYLIGEAPDLVGISTHCTAWAKLADDIARIASSIKPKPIVITGGVHASVAASEVAATGLYDVVFRGEAENTLIQFIGAVTKGSGIINEVSGISFLSKNGTVVHVSKPEATDLHSLPFIPDLEIEIRRYPLLSPYFGNKETFSIITERGCSFGCPFCSVGEISGHAIRSMTAEEVIGQIKHIVSNFGITNFNIADDGFTYDLKRARRFSELLLEERKAGGLPQIAWKITTRADRLPDDLLEIMAEAGLKYINIGVESGDEEVLQNVKKSAILNETRRVISTAHSLGMKIKYLLMVGLPGQTIESVKQTVAFIRETRPDDVFVHIYMPWPGSKFSKDHARWGVRVLETDTDLYIARSAVKDIKPVSVIETDWMTKEEIEVARRMILDAVKEIRGSEPEAFMPGQDKN